MSTTIRIYSTITKDTYKKTLSELEAVEPGSRVVFKLNCAGAKESAHIPILDKITELRDKHQCYLKAEGQHFYSAAFMLFIMCHERVIIPESRGMIHLSEFSNREAVRELDKLKRQQCKQTEDTEFIKNYTNMSVEDVYQHNLILMTPGQMFKWKIADKIVSYFYY